MQTFNCIIVDDSEIDQLSLRAFLSKFPEFKILGVFSNPVKALEILENIEIDVLFLDIQMPHINGLEFRKRAHKIPACVFISYSPDYALESFELEVLDYVVKPLKLERFEKTLQKIKTHLSITALAKARVTKDEPIFIKNGIEKIQIHVNEILFLEAFSDYTHLVTSSGRQTLSSNIGKTLQTTPFKDFVRIHRSFAIARKSLSKIYSTKVILTDGTKLPVGRTYKQNLQNL